MAALMMLIGLVAFFSMPKDIFPAVDIPEINLVWYYPGMSAPEIEQRIVNITERAASQTVNGIDHIESTSFTGIGVVKIYMQEGSSTALGISQLDSVTSAIRNILPPGIAPPTVLDFDATNVPIADLVATSQSLSDTDLYDYMFNFVGLFLFTQPGLQSPAPFGGASRQIMLNLVPDRLYAKGLSPQDVLNSLQASNVILPGGTVKLGNYEYDVMLNSSPVEVDDFNRMPIKYQNGAMVFIGDVAKASDSHAVQTDIARVNGRRASFRYILKHASASTLTVIDEVKSVIPRVQALAPAGTKIFLAFDQSEFVKASLVDVFQEIFIASSLVGLMTVIFLGSWRSSLILITSIPLAIMTSLAGLYLTGNTINIMTLGGLALSVGMLVDDATVEVENIHRNHTPGKPLITAILEGASQIATPTLVGTLSICVVFFPVVLLSGVARYLFPPLALAVVFAMLTSYLLSRTLVPAMASYLLPDFAETAPPSGLTGRFLQRFEHGFERVREAYSRALAGFIAHRGLALTGAAVMIVGSLPLMWVVGQDFFPSVDSGLMRLHVRAPTGTRIEATEWLINKIDLDIRRVIPASELQSISDNIGVPQSFVLACYPTDSIGEQDADIMIELAPTHKPTADYEAALRLRLARDFPGVETYFQPADIISQVLSFGLPAPIDAQISGPSLRDRK